MKFYKWTPVVTGLLLLSACHHDNPLKTNPPKDSAYFLMNASANVEKRLHFAIKEGDLGIAFVECMEGNKSPEINCDALLQGIVVFAREGHYPNFKTLTLSDLKDPYLLKLGDDIVEVAVSNWPTFFAMVRAITTREIYALSGNKVLIPKGATLVGQFNTGINQGQSRVFIVWNRVQLSNGIIATLNSPSSDTLGRSGSAADYIDRHFFERFANAALLSVLGAYSATAGVNGQDQYNSMAQYRMNVAGGFQQAANQALQQDMQTRPTLQMDQGASINVFVAHDLDFYRVASRG